MTIRPLSSLVSSQTSSTSTKPMASLSTKMATAETWRTPPVVVRSQIVENCAFFSPPGAQLSVILTREPLGTYKAIILRSRFGSQRQVLLSSESADTVHRAFELLLVKSADAVQHYITTNGFEYAPVSKKIEDIIIDADCDDNNDDGISSVSSSEILDDDLDNKDLDDSTLSLSEVESAYDSVSEDGIDARHPRARATHTTPRAYSMRVRRRSRSPRLDDPDFPREGRQQQQQQRGGPAPPHHHHGHHLPHHNFPIHRRRSSPMRVPNPPVSAAVVDGPAVRRHFPVVGGEPPAPPPRMMHPGGSDGCSWRHTLPGGPMPPPIMHTNTMNLRPEPAGPPRSHPSQYFSLQAQLPPPPPPPPPPGMKLVPPPPPPPPPQAAAAAAVLQRQPQVKPPVSINNGPSPPGISPSQTTIAPPPPPPPLSLSSSSSLSSASSTPTLTASPNKPPSPTATPAAIDYRLCIRSRNPSVTGPRGGTQAQQQTPDQQWREQRIILRTPPTRGHIRAAALRFVELNPGLFRHLSNAGSNNNGDYSPACRSPEGFGGGGFGGGRHQQQQQQQQQQQLLLLQSLRATLTRAVFRDGESYDLSTYAEDDLGRLCASMCAAGQGGMPLFEVTVSNVGPAGSFFTISS